MRIIQEIVREKNCNGLIIENIESADVVYFTEEEAIELRKYFTSNVEYRSFHREGIWLVKKEEDAHGTPYLKSSFLEAIDENIKAYPFINVEKYRQEIEDAIIEYSNFYKENIEKEDDSLNILKGMTNSIILAISKKILQDKEKSTLSKEDFYESI